MHGETMRQYGKRLEDALKRKKPFFTHNRDIRHAFVIIVAAFLHAEREVLLLSHELERIFYGHRAMLGAIKDFLGRTGGRLRVLVEKPIDADHPMLELAVSMPEQITIRRIPAGEIDYDYNFMLMDDCGYRYEPDRKSKSASASFYDKEADGLIKQMRARFESMAAKSAPLSFEASS